MMKLATSANGGSHMRVIFPKLLWSVVTGDHKVFVEKYNRGPFDFGIGDRKLISPDLDKMTKAKGVEVIKDDSFLPLVAIPPLG
jgi:hypothetical protein